jgi:hypothetical protein
VIVEFLTWGALLVLQSATHTASSRAKNSDSLLYSGIAGAFSHGVWFASQFFIVKNLMAADGDYVRFALVGFFYITLATAGTVGSHAWLIRFERRNGL